MAAERLSTDIELVNLLGTEEMRAARVGASGEARSPLSYAALGDADRAVGWLERYSPAEDLHYQLHLRCDPPFKPIEDDPRFRSLLIGQRPTGSRGC